MSEYGLVDVETEESVKTRAAGEKFPTRTYSECVLSECFEDAKRLFLKELIEVDCAHVVMLAEQGIITDLEARTLAAALGNLDLEQIKAAKYDGTFEDLFFYIERLITEATGDDVAGSLHTARSRNDIDVTIYRMRLRRDVLEVVRSAMVLRYELLNIQERHHKSVM